MASQPLQPSVMTGLPRSGMVQLPNGQMTKSPIPPHASGPGQGPIMNGSGHIQQAPPPPQQQQPNPGIGGPPPMQQQLPPQEISQFQKLQAENAECWLAVGKLAEIMGDFDRAVASYDASLRLNSNSIPTLRAIANLYRSKEKFSKAVEYYQSILRLNQHSGETWGCLGMCFVLEGK